MEKEDGIILIAYANGKPIVFLIGALKNPETWRKIGKTAEMEVLFVSEKYRNMGIGTRMCNKFIEWCELRNVNVLKLESHAYNKEAIEFYKKNKFKEYHLIMERGL